MQQKKNSIILDIDEDELNLFNKQYLSLPELYEEIEALFEEGEKMDKRKKKQVIEWKEKINFLIDMYNTKSKFKTHNKVK